MSNLSSVDYPQDVQLSTKSPEWREGYETALKELHAWACGKYNEAENGIFVGLLPTNKLYEKIGRKNALQDVKKKIMSMYE